MQRLSKYILVILLLFPLLSFSQNGAGENIDKLILDDEATNNVAEGNKPVSFDGYNVDTLSYSGSLMFSDAELSVIYDNIISNNSNKNKDNNVVDAAEDMLVDVSGKVSDKLGDKQVIISPSFFLSTIIFISDDKWSFWVNKKRYRNNDDGEFEIKRLNSKQVELVWVTDKLNVISPNYKNKLSKLNSSNEVAVTDEMWDLGSEDGRVLVDSVNGKIKFILEQNQTLSVFDMKIYEGYKEPVTIQTGDKPVEKVKKKDAKIDIH